MTVGDDERAFAALFDGHRGPVHAYLVGRMSDREVANDLLQETFLRAWRRLGELRGLAHGRQRAWLITVARNLTIDTYRTRATRQATADAIGHQPPVRDPREDDPVRQVVGRSQVDRVERAIAALPEDERTVLAMSVMAEMTSAQIGEALDRPAGTIRYTLHRARTALAAVLAEE